NFTALDFSVLQSRKSEAFGQYLDSLFIQTGNPLKFSFEPAVISGMSFSYIFNNNIIGQNRRAHYWRLFVESGGTSLNLLRQQRLPWGLEGFELYKFLKINGEFRKYIPINTKSTLVYRFNGGVIYNYNNRRVAPYEKSFTAGGPNSLRAWLPRRLGLGSAFPNIDLRTGSPLFRTFGGLPNTIQPGVLEYGGFDYRFEQLGDVLMEANLELRGHLFRFNGDFNYALFLDAGNIWRLRLDRNTQPSLNIQRGMFALDRFFREIAIGTGVGIRYDLSFFIIRLDMGIKVFDPSRRFETTDLQGRPVVIDERYLLPHFSFRRSSPNFPVFNIGVGYPF
ncbi:MAG: BamA/TamA family outer membrane protein, partial [Runella sp.]